MKPILLSIRSILPMRSVGVLVVMALVCAASAHGQDVRSRSTAPADGAVESEIARYCGNLAPTASEARAAYQARQLGELEDRVRRSTEELEQRAIEAREWVARREAMMKAATDDIVAVYAKMPADAAATQLSAMEDSMAAAVLVKLNPRAASAILGEMEAGKAATLAAIMVGAAVADKS